MITDLGHRTYARRLTLLSVALTFAAAIIVGQVVRFQIVRHDEILEAWREYVERISTVKSARGTVMDINRRILAMDQVEWEISASPPLILEPEEDAKKLAALLGMPEGEILAALTAPQPWISLVRRAPQEVGEAVLAAKIYGITCDPYAKRVYAAGGLTSHVQGIVNDSGDGFHGVEGYYDLYLKPQEGRKQSIRGPDGQEIPLPAVFLEPSRAGTSLVLTLDLIIQYIVAEELSRALREFEAEHGTVVVMNPRTGAILASVSYPTYDPNAFATTDLRLISDPATSSQWEPGSIFKIVTWAAALDAGTITPGTLFQDSGMMEVGGRVIQNWDRKGHGVVTMEEALIQSLNTGAAFISTSMGKDRFYTYVRRFGFGNLTLVDLASEERGVVKLPGDTDWFPSELGTNAFGQGIAVTPIQMLVAAAAVANDGVMMKPHIVDHFLVADEDTGKERIVRVEPTVIRNAVSREAAQTLTQMLVKVAEGGSGQARVSGYLIAGKTGTAQVPTAYGYHPTDTIASFIGYAPADDPQFIVLVKLDKPRKSPWGSWTAAPTFRAIAERLFLYLQIPPDAVRQVGG